MEMKDRLAKADSAVAAAATELSVTEKVLRFQAVRAFEKERLYFRVFRCMVLGFMISWLSMAFGRLAVIRGLINSFSAQSLYFVCSCFFSCALVVISSDDIDFDIIPERYPRFTLVALIACGLQSVHVVWEYGVSFLLAPLHATFFMLCRLYGMMLRRDSPMKLSTFLSVGASLFGMSAGVFNYYHIAAEARNGDCDCHLFDKSSYRQRATWKSIAYCQGPTTYHINGCLFFFGSAGILCQWLWRGAGSDRNPREIAWSPTLECIRTAYYAFMLNGVVCFVHFCRGLLGERNCVVTLPYLYLAYSFILFFPPVFVIAVGREKTFKFILRRFDRRHAEMDGAFMAELLTDRDVVKGMIWWIHHGANYETEDPFDPSRNWTKGRVVEVAEEAFLVDTAVTETPKLSLARTTLESRLSTASSSNYQPREFHRVLMLDRLMPARDLLALGRRNLRCINWEAMTFELMSGTTRAGRTAGNYDLSRPVLAGEKIDYFLSHSWHDDAVAKWRQLVFIAERFRGIRGRYPTFWLDKVCIDQACISDGLKVLPVNVMACSKVLVLCGRTYTERLWCAWELCTLFSFISTEQATHRVDLIPVGKGCIAEAVSRLARFDFRDAHCYNPNEEHTLRDVIEATGGDRFNDCVRQSATACLEAGNWSQFPLGLEI